MKFLVQRVLEANVKVDGEVMGSINKGLLVFVGVGHEDNEAIADKMIDKLTRLRIFDDENGKTNLSISDVGGEFLIISQFTLYADCRRGNRPSFTDAGSPDAANSLYEYVLSKISSLGFKCEHGSFGADMKVSLINDGPFTIYLDSKEIVK